jgi:hypothetical protein
MRSIDSMACLSRFDLLLACCSFAPVLVRLSSPTIEIVPGQTRQLALALHSFQRRERQPAPLGNFQTRDLDLAFAGKHAFLMRGREPTANGVD